MISSQYQEKTYKVDSLDKINADLLKCVTYLSNGKSALEVQSYMDNQKNADLLKELNYKNNQHIIQQLRAQLGDAYPKDIIFEDNTIEVTVPLQSRVYDSQFQMDGILKSCFLEIAEVFKTRPSYQLLIDANINFSQHNNLTEQAISFVTAILRERGNINLGRRETAGPLPSGPAGLNQNWIRISAFAPDKIILSQPEKSTIPVKSKFDIGEELRKTLLTIYNAEPKLSILLGTQPGNEKEYVVTPQVWYSPSYNTGPIIFKMKTGDNWVQYSLDLGKRYIITWNNEKKLWDLANASINEN